MSFNPSSGIINASDVEFNAQANSQLVSFNPVNGRWGNANISAMIQTYGTLVTEHGVSINSTADQVIAIQDCLDTYKRICLPDGNYYCNGPLLIDAEMSIYLAKGANLIKNFGKTQSNGSPRNDGGVFIRNRTWGSTDLKGNDPTTPVSNFKVWGPGKISAADSSMSGDIFRVYGHDMRFYDFTIDGFFEGRAVVLAGDRIRMRNVKTKNYSQVTGTGGIRYVGGDNFIATNCHIESGDDSLQFVPSETSTNPLYSMDITNSAYIGCTGISYDARFMAVVTGFNTSDLGNRVIMDSSIRNSSFIGCHGRGGGRAAIIENSSSSGIIENITLRDCSIDMSDGEGKVAEITIDGLTNPELGGVRGAKIIQTTVTNPSTASLNVAGQVNDVIIEDCMFVRTTNPTLRGREVMRLSGKNTKVIRGKFDGDGSNGDVISVLNDDPSDSDNPLPSRFSIIGAHIFGIANNKFGIGIDDCDDPRISDCTFKQHVSATSTARAVRLASTVSGARIDNNNVRSLQATSKYADTTGNTIYTNNIGG